MPISNLIDPVMVCTSGVLKAPWIIPMFGQGGNQGNVMHSWLLCLIFLSRKPFFLGANNILFLYFLHFPYSYH